MLRRENKKEAERSLSLPIFPTVGGKFAVPLIPASASIMSPNDAWDESLSPHFPDFLISWEGAAGELLREFEVQRPSLANFLANFCAPRAGLFDQQLSLHFLESIAALGTVFKASGASRDCEKLAQVCEAGMLSFHLIFMTATPLPSSSRRVSGSRGSCFVAERAVTDKAQPRATSLVLAIRGNSSKGGGYQTKPRASTLRRTC